MVRNLSPRLPSYSSIVSALASDALLGTAAELGTVDICGNISEDTKHVFKASDIFWPVVTFHIK